MLETQGAELISGSRRAEQSLYVIDMTVYNGSTVDIPLYEGASITVLESLIEQFSWSVGDHPGISINKPCLKSYIYYITTLFLLMKCFPTAMILQ